MKGKISKIKNTKGELALPVTTAEAVYLEDGKTLNDEINDINSSLDNITQDTSVVITVGNNGDYKTINEAIAYLSRKKLKYNNSGFKAEILLKSGFTISEQIFVKNIDLGFITISSEDEVVKADCTNFKQNVYEEPYGDSGYPVNSASIFTGYGNAVIPNINILVDMQNTTSAQAGTSGICLIYGATGRIERKKGFVNSGSTGVFILEASRLYATDTIIKDSFGNNISCFRGSYILFRGGVATGSKTGYGVYLDNACIGDFVSSNLSENKESGAWVSGLSLLSANRSIVNNNGRNGVSADNSSIIDIHKATIIGNEQSGIACTSSRVSANNSTITNNGVSNITVSNGGIVDAQNSNLTNSLGANSVYVNYGGILNISKSNAQKVDGVNGKDIRVGYGGIIYAHGTIGGYSGSAPNSLSKNGIIFNESDTLTEYGKVGRVKNKMIWSTIKNGCIASSLFPIDYVTQKNITIQGINIHESGNLTSEEVALVKIEKLTDGVCFLVYDNSLANKLSGCATNITLIVTLIDEEDV